jgi:hypothetical protein
VRQRLHALFSEAWHLVLLVVAAGVAIGGMAALIGYAAGKRGGDLVLTVVIVVGLVGVVTVFVGVLADPMSHEAVPLFMRPRSIDRSFRKQGKLLQEEEHGLDPATKERFRTDDLFYAGGVLLIGFAVLLGYVCAWAGHAPANPFHS